MSLPLQTTFFTPVAGGAITLPPLPGVLNIGDITSATQSVNVPVTGGSRMVLVVSLTVSGVGILATLVGYLSAGISIV